MYSVEDSIHCERQVLATPIRAENKPASASIDLTLAIWFECWHSERAIRSLDLSLIHI